MSRGEVEGKEHRLHLKETGWESGGVVVGSSKSKSNVKVV